MKQEPLIIDRIEGSTAVTEDGVNLSLKYFPTGARDGHHYKLVRDEESERNLRTSIGELQDEIRNPSGKGTKHL